MSLKGKIALITGASRGIGAAIAIELAREGADIAITYSSNTDAAQKVCLLNAQSLAISLITYIRPFPLSSLLGFAQLPFKVM